jgi:hypothetical protein
MRLLRRLLSLMLLATAIAWLLSVGASASSAETFSFGGSQNGFNGQPSATLTAGDFMLQLDAGIPGSLLNEPQEAGMGIDSRPVAGAGDLEPALFNTILGAGPLAGAAEWLRFSFDGPGVITGINFDGVKDESLEYFILESTGGVRYNFFDSAANNFVAGFGNRVSNAIGAGAVTGTVVYLLEINDTIDDEAQGLHIPFAAGQEVSLSFHSLTEFGPLEPANGARLQGITVEAVPEPVSSMLALVGALAASIFSTGRHRRIS